MALSNAWDKLYLSPPVLLSDGESTLSQIASLLPVVMFLFVKNCCIFDADSMSSFSEMQIDSRVLGFIGAGVSMLINSWLQGLLSFAHVSLITVNAGTHNTIHKVWAFFFGSFVFDVD